MTDWRGVEMKMAYQSNKVYIIIVRDSRDHECDRYSCNEKTLEEVLLNAIKKIPYMGSVQVKEIKNRYGE